MCNTNKNFRTVSFQLLITGITLVLLFSKHSDLFAQSAEDSVTSKSFRSFRIKMELVSFTGLNPNLYFEYKINKNYGLNLGFLYHFTGIIWTAPYLLRKEFYEYQEWLALKGYGVDFGIKYYSAPTKYYSLRCIIDLLNFKKTLQYGESLSSRRNENLVRKDIRIQLLRGFEIKNKSHYFREIFYGVGLLIVNEHYKYGFFESSYNPPSKFTNGIDNYIVPTFHFGINIGWKSIPKISTKNNEQ